jgi:N-acetylglutamate synthase-like GNAT family acetyltransferase
MSTYRTRRATVDDLARLLELWQAAQLPVAVLEKQFTDFQVAEDEQGKVVAAIGLHIEAGSGRVHSETFADFGLTDTLRPALWARLQVVAQNHGLFRLWTEEAAPWWKKDAGFTTAPDEVLEKLPASYGPRHTAWLTLRLRDEAAAPDQLEKEIAMFKEAERAKLEKLIQRGKAMKIFGTLIAALLFLSALIMLFYVLKHRRQ